MLPWREMWAARWTILTALAWGCGSEKVVWHEETSAGPGAEGGQAGSGAGAAGVGVGGVGGSDPGTCVELEHEAIWQPWPTDLVLVADNGPEMTGALDRLETLLGADWPWSPGEPQVIVVSDHGPGPQQLCVASSLSNTADCSGPPGDVPGVFHHYDVVIDGPSTLCQLLATLKGPGAGGQPDEHDLHPDGWLPWLRPEAMKVVLVATTKGVSCTIDGTTLDDQDDPSREPQSSAAAQAASAWQNLLFAAAPGHFAPTTERPGYRMMSLIGVAAGSPQVLHGFDAPLVLDGCSSLVSVGLGYQWLSKMRHGVRVPICGSDPLAQLGVGEILVPPKSPDCSPLTLPERTEGHVWDLDGLTITFEGAPLERVADETACGDRSDAYFRTGTTVTFCPYTCDYMNALVETPSITLCEAR